MDPNAFDIGLIKNQSSNFKDYLKYVDKDIVEFFLEEVSDYEGKKKPRWYFTPSTGSVMVELQLIRALKERLKQ